MPAFPISPLSPELTLIKPIGSSENRLGPVANVSDGLLGIGGIGKVELPGVGVFTPGGLSAPQAPNLLQPVPSTSPAPEVTPFPSASPLPSKTPTLGPTAIAAPTPSPATIPAPTTTPVPSGAPVQTPAQGSPYATPPITTTTIPEPIRTPYTPAPATIPVKQTPLADTFGKYLKDAVSNFSEVQNQADTMIQRLAVGDKVDIHDVTLALQKASLTNQLAIQVRNRLVEAYQEVMRMSM